MQLRLDLNNKSDEIVEDREESVFFVHGGRGLVGGGRHRARTITNAPFFGIGPGWISARFVKLMAPPRNPHGIPLHLSSREEGRLEAFDPAFQIAAMDEIDHLQGFTGDFKEEPIGSCDFLPKDVRPEFQFAHAREGVGVASGKATYRFQGRGGDMGRQGFQGLAEARGKYRYPDGLRALERPRVGQ